MKARTPLNDLVGCVRRNFWRWLVASVLMGGVVYAYLTAVDTRHEGRQQRQADARAARLYLCEKINELPAKIGRALALTEQRRQIIGPTTTVPPADLTPDEQAQLNQITAALAAVVADLGRPIDCGVASTGRTSTTTGR